MSVKFGSKDLQLQLLAIYLLFVLPIFGLAFFFYTDESRRLQEDVTAADLSLARAIALETDELLQLAQAALIEYAQHPAVIEANPALLETIFQAGVSARQDVNLFYRLSAEGIMLYHYPPEPASTRGQDFSFRPYFQQAKASGQHVFSEGRISPTTNQPVVTSVMPVLQAGRFDGVVAANLDLRRLTETVQQISQKRPPGEHVEIIIIDAVGQVIAHSQPDKLLTNLSGNLPAVKPVLSGQEGSLIERDPAGQEWLYSYAPVPSAGWGVLVQHSTALAFSSLNRFRQGFLLALVVVGLGAILFWYMLSYRVMLPLAQLTRYGENVSQEVAGGEQSPLTITPLAGRQDQIGRLARTLLQAEQSIRRRLMELTTLNKTSKSVVSTLDTQQVINAILDEIQHLFQIRQCALQVITPETEKLTIRASRGLSATYVEHLNQAPVTRVLPAFRAIESGQAVQIPDIEADPTLVDLLPLARAEGYRSLLAIPLIAPHVPPAALIIYHPHIYHFTTQEIDLVTNFANYAAIALEHATLFSLTDAELQQQVRFLSALNKVGHTVSQSLLVDDVLNSAIDTVFEVLPIESCWICMYREEEDFMRLRAQRGLTPALIEQLEQEGSDSDQGLVGHVVQSGRPLLLGQSSLVQSAWPTDPLVTHGDWQFLAVTPLPAKDSTIGVLGVAGHSEHDFAGPELELLQAIGDQIAIAVINARLYRRSREVATLEERNRVAREIHDTLAQGFTGIIINLQTAERLYARSPDEALNTLRDACDLARQSLQEARRSVLNLRPGILEALTIDRALAQHLENFAAETGLKTEFKVSGYPSRLDIRTEHNLYRIAQEALTNVKRHARAKQVTVGLEYNRASVSLTIADDGIGLDGAHLATSNGHNEAHGFGLVGIHERVHQIGGRVSFTPPATGGTQIKVVVDK